MRGHHILWLGMFLLFPSAANAACQPSFVDSSNSVALTPSSSLDEQQIVERFHVRVRNDGDSACALQLTVGRDLGASDPEFPAYTLAGPSGIIPIVSATDASGDAGTPTNVNIPAGGQVSIPYDVRLRIGWGSQAGDYAQQLIYALRQSGMEAIPAQRTQLLLNIPSAARIRFAGAHGDDGPSLLDMGPLSSDTPTYSPPFAIRVLSTAGYQMQLVSQNAGALVRLGGSERIPYALSLGGRPMNLVGGGDMVSAGRHTSSSGDVHPVAITINPDPTRHAGDYSDRITITVTPI